MNTLFFKYLFRRLPLAMPLFGLLREPAAQWRALRAWRRFAASVDFACRSATTGAPRTLVASFMGDDLESTKIEAFFAKALQQAGQDIVVLAGAPWCWSKAVHRSVGLRQFVHFDIHLIRAQRELARLGVSAEAMLAGVGKEDDLLGLEWHNVRVGRYAASTLLRSTYCVDILPKTEAGRAQLAAALNHALICTLAAGYVLDEVRPDRILLNEHGYMPYAACFDLGLHRGVDVIQWNGSHNSKSQLLTRYTPDNRGRHPSSLSADSWKRLKTVSWSPELGDATREELRHTYASGDWYSEVGTQFGTKLIDQRHLITRLTLDPAKKTAVIFAHILWDATFFYGRDLFDDYRHWLAETVRAAAENPNLNWIVKVHPANLIKAVREGQQVTEWAEATVVRETLRQLPPHMVLLPPETDISTLSLFQATDYCLTVRGTVGLEAAIFGCRVLTAGTGRYDGHGFTDDSESAQEFLHKVRNLHLLPRLTPAEQELAERFAAGVFLSRPLRLVGLELGFERDAKATQRVSWKCANDAAFTAAPDVRNFADWATTSREEDYLDLSALRPRTGSYE